MRNQEGGKREECRGWLDDALQQICRWRDYTTLAITLLLFLISPSVSRISEKYCR